MPGKRPRRGAKAEAASPGDVRDTTSSSAPSDKKKRITVEQDLPASSSSTSTSTKEQPTGSPVSSSSQFSNPGTLKATTLMSPSVIVPTMSTDELTKKLKVVTTHLYDLKQQENENDYEDLLPFCNHLAGDDFLNHPNRDVRLQVACCISEMFRIFVPDAPFKEFNHIKTIFKFLISQLEGLNNTGDVLFKRYFYLLENLSSIKCFNLCFDLEDEDAQDIFIALFETIFSTISNDHSERVRLAMEGLLSPILMECPCISYELLDVILKNILEPVKSSRKVAYNLAKELIVRCEETLESYISSLLNTILIGNVEEYECIWVAHRVFKLIMELHLICPSILQSALPQLEYKLKSLNDKERLGAVSLLARIFSDRSPSSSSFVKTPLWQAFIGRFNDISVEVRRICVQYSMHFLLNHEDTRKDIEECLCSRLHDSDELVRFEVMKSIITIATTTTEGFEYVVGNQQLLDCIKDRTMDKKGKIRNQALQGLAKIYKMYLDMQQKNNADSPPAWIHNRILQGYYIDQNDDRAIIERLLNTCLVPYKLNAKERMIQLLYLCSTANENAYKAFIETQKTVTLLRRRFSELLNCIQNPRPNKEQQTKSLNNHISALIKFHPVSADAAEFLPKLVNDLKKSSSLMKSMELIIKPTSDCKTVTENVYAVLKSMDPPVATNLYYSTIKALLERASAVLIDKEAILELLKLVQAIVAESSQDDMLGRRKFPATPILVQQAANLICALSFLYSVHFHNPEALEILVNLLHDDNLEKWPASTILKSFAQLGKTIKVDTDHSFDTVMKKLKSHCISVVDSGSPREAKMAIRCLYANVTNEHSRMDIFSKVLEIIKTNLQGASTSAAYATAVVGLGHVAFLMPNEFKPIVKGLVSKNIIKDLLLHPERSASDSTKNLNKIWVELDELPQITRTMVYGMKTCVRWLLGLQKDMDPAVKAFKMFTAFVSEGGNFLQKDNESYSYAFTASENAWLRLAAGNCVLKIIPQKGVGDGYNANQFCTVAQLMTDENSQVRFRFAAKLHKGLSKGIPHKCLPYDFLGFYTLGALEPDRKQRAIIKRYMQTDISLRRSYIRVLQQNNPDNEKMNEHLPYLMPDYMFAFAISVLANHPRFQSLDEIDDLIEVKKCLTFVLESIVAKGEGDFFSFSSFSTMVQMIKNRRNAAALEGDEEQADRKMYAVCDVAFEVLILCRRLSNIPNSATGQEPTIPAFFFSKHENPTWTNTASYLSDEFFKESQKKKGSPGRTPRVNVSTSRRAVTKINKIPNVPSPAPASGATPKSRNGGEGRKKRGSKRGRNETEELKVLDTSHNGNLSINAQPTNTKRSRVEVTEMFSSSSSRGGSDESTDVSQKSLQSGGVDAVQLSVDESCSGSEQPMFEESEEERVADDPNNESKHGTDEDDDEENEFPPSPESNVPIVLGNARVTRLRQKLITPSPPPARHILRERKKKSDTDFKKSNLKLRTKNKM